MPEAEVEKTPYWIKWVIGGDPEWTAMGPEGEIGCFNDRIEALTATADVMSLPLDMVDMGDTFHDLPDGDCWMTVTERAEPYKPPYIPPTLDWQIEGLIEEGSPVVDTSESAQWGWRGTALNRPGGLRVCWTIPGKTDGTFRWSITSITFGSGLDLSLRAGRNRAVDWLCERLGIANRMPTSPVFSAVGGGRWRLNIFPDTTVNFDPAPGDEESDVFIVPALAEIAAPDEQFGDGTFIVDAEAIKAIVEWVCANPSAVSHENLDRDAGGGG